MDLGGEPLTHAPHGRKFSQFHAIVWTIWQNGTPGPPPSEGWRPLLRGILDLSLELRFIFTLFHRRSEPHGNCISTQEYGGSGQCYDDCLNRAVWEECDCNPATNLVNPGDKEACLSVLLPKTKLIRYQDCANHTIWTVSGQCSDSCRLGCSETRYKTQPSYARWPIPYQAESFYRQFVESKPYSKMFETPSVPHSTDNENLEKLLNSWLRRQLIENNFVKIDFVLDFTSYLEFTEVPQYSLFSFLGTLGGSLNLWTGITVVVVIEIIETMINILMAKRDKNIINVESKTAT